MLIIIPGSRKTILPFKNEKYAPLIEINGNRIFLESAWSVICYIYEAIDINSYYAYIKFLNGEEAAKAYDKADKHNAIEFQYDNGFMGDDFSIPLSNNHNTSKKIFESGLIEFYVFGENFSWCFIVTHEPNCCGPYFIKKQSPH